MCSTFSLALTRSQHQFIQSLCTQFYWNMRTNTPSIYRMSEWIQLYLSEISKEIFISFEWKTENIRNTLREMPQNILRNSFIWWWFNTCYFQFARRHQHQQPLHSATAKRKRIANCQTPTNHNNNNQPMKDNKYTCITVAVSRAVKGERERWCRYEWTWNKSIWTWWRRRRRNRNMLLLR